MDAFIGTSRFQPMQILSVGFYPAELSVLPRHIRVPGCQFLHYSIEALRAFDWAAGAIPSFVISPLVTPLFDAQDLANLLVENRFQGRYLAIADTVMDPSVIRADIANVAPFLNFDVVALDRRPVLRAV